MRAQHGRGMNPEACCGAYIRLKDGNIDCPGNLSMKAANIDYSGPTRSTFPTDYNASLSPVKMARVHYDF
ncbi:MAG: DUF2345 domain-containing protein [Azoarcus sp.]|jgi:uncharacterized protein (DUF2345 family)|nr:DUF2345 domain-containing protein [Azoarcus sp.]